MANNHSHDESPIVLLVDNLLQQAVLRGASDIHCESTLNGLKIRERLDGVLYDGQTIDLQTASQILARIKVLAHIDSSQKRIPQDGKFCAPINGHEIDFRVSTFPSIHGEKIVIRILDRSNQAIAIEQLGFTQTMLADIKDLISKSSGFFLVSGPTGSGKTTTLYAILSSLNSPQKNIITLEDPVEYNVAGITQGQIHPEAGFTFEKGMRALLRQDPNIIMIGEIRDKQSAQIAIEASLTGHVVLSTVHTNDASSVIMRLMDMGIEPFLINAALTGMLAQRLARTICSECKIHYSPTTDEQQFISKHNLAITKLYKGTGCPACLQTGYKGRTGVFELVHMTPSLRNLVSEKPIFDDVIAQARHDGSKSMLHDGAYKVQEGIITLAELIRAVS